MHIQLGYPDPKAERALLTGQSRQSFIPHRAKPSEFHPSLRVQLPPDKPEEMQTLVTKVYTSDALLDYCQAIINFTHESTECHCGLLSKAGLALLSTAKA